MHVFKKKKSSSKEHQRPNFLIIGAARCGTTWLAKNLMLHPEIFMPSQKELHFFDMYYDKGISWYEDIFKNAKEKIIGEATPAYLNHKYIPYLIKKYLPDVKLITCLRDPVDRAYSHYWYREDERRAKNITITFEDKIQTTPHLIEQGLYARHLSEYLTLFPRNKILFLFYEDLKNNPTQYLRNLYNFLEVDTNFKSPLIDKQLNAAASKLGKTNILYCMQKSFNKIGAYSIAKCLDNLNRKQIPSIKLKTRRSLINQFYIEDITQLESITKRDLSLWKI